MSQGVQHRRVQLVNPRGLHARPCTLIAKAAAAFDADLTVTAGGESADGRRVLELLTLSAACGDWVELQARGPGAKALLEALESLFRSGFQDPD
jgi:phosphotransferase system HPr (HPr) family protein